MRDGCRRVGGSPYAALVILIDAAIWPAHDRLWCHMVSDTSLVELHEFAARLGVPERGFEGDHYDIPEQLRAAAVREGAVEVSSRTLVEALYEAGLRQRPTTRG